MPIRQSGTGFATVLDVLRKSTQKPAVPTGTLRPPRCHPRKVAHIPLRAWSVEMISAGSTLCFGLAPRFYSASSHPVPVPTTAFPVQLSLEVSRRLLGFSLSF